jgi:methyl-accepting chemotaxis protein
MSPGNILELLIILVIILGIGAAIWRGGARNPVGTGGLDKKLTNLSSELKAINATIGNKIAGVEGKVDEIETRLEQVERDAVTPADIKRLERSVEKLAKNLPDLESRLRAQAEKQGEHAATSAATAATVQQISKQLDLIMSVVVPKGMEK